LLHRWSISYRQHKKKKKGGSKLKEREREVTIISAPVALRLSFNQPFKCQKPSLPPTRKNNEPIFTKP